MINIISVSPALANVRQNLCLGAGLGVPKMLQIGDMLVMWIMLIPGFEKSAQNPESVDNVNHVNSSGTTEGAQ